MKTKMPDPSVAGLAQVRHDVKFYGKAKTAGLAPVALKALPPVARDDILYQQQPAMT